MNFKNDELYPIYLNYLETKKLSNGGLKLAKISLDMFNEFSKRYTNDLDFKQKQDDLFVSVRREMIIQDILEDDFEIIVEDNKKKIEDDEFFDF